MTLFVLVGMVISGLSESRLRAHRRIGASERQRADESLSQERYLLHTLMDNLPDLIYFKDAASRFLSINKALTTYFGLSDPEQAIGKTDFEFFTQGHTQLAGADEREIIRELNEHPSLLRHGIGRIAPALLRYHLPEVSPLPQTIIVLNPAKSPTDSPDEAKSRSREPRNESTPKAGVTLRL